MCMFYNNHGIYVCCLMIVADMCVIMIVDDVCVV